ncbi:DUF262 domain-containing protein [Flavobacterium sp. HJSW_4]|uniref:DUF262 domain-containing protein n=1 Tax=Flavobacterium sp. HJSW_4 TaxID=3344660 RepID=UPI0035F24B90
MNNKFTPATIGQLSFSIPLYQRLFEWTEKEIFQLLTDLYTGFKTNKKNPYYIGMLTIFKNGGEQSLVDGQQRFTVLNLMGLAFDSEDWKKFVKPDEYRLKFFAREKDANYIKSIFEKTVTNDAGQYVNKKMRDGIKTINSFIDNLSADKNEFINYIYEKATFFISELPESYTAQDLNRYFEAMNASGKGLENHEILKVDLLKKISDDKSLYTQIWNAVSEMDKSLIRPHKEETVSNLQLRIKKSLYQLSNYKKIAKYCNDIKTDENGKTEEKEIKTTIKQITSSSKRPNPNYIARSEKSILNFTEFLLQVLWLQLSEEERKTTTNFFNTYKLQETFNKNLKNDEVKTFFENLLKYKLLFDQFVVRITHNEQNDTSYFINFNDNDANPNDGKKITQYQSMLYVSTSYHLWLTKLLEYIAQNPADIKAEEFIETIKEYDNERFSIENFNSSNLAYGSIDRYWFWRLDYYLWENRNVVFKDDKSIKIAENYLFKSNRSIEHIAPQTPQRNSTVKLDKDDLDRFGNLAMISSGQNSSLQNEPFEIKRAHVRTFINESKNGTIESLKMLHIHNFETWDIDEIKKHECKMATVLKNSFPNNSAMFGYLSKIAEPLSNTPENN